LPATPSWPRSAVNSVRRCRSTRTRNAELNIFLPTSDTFSAAAAVLNIAAPILALIPQFDAHATPLGVGAKVGFGGVQLSKAAKFGAEGAELISNAFKSSAERASRLAGYYRRRRGLRVAGERRDQRTRAVRTADRCAAR